ncbi:protein quick-to-court isoform X2 [Ischnura elegans]|uniref:protein quick-to-court isoform X2 n=1 Tax=Ischnura elegans TaxID=197161 RepID=UPI001ED8B450|nr:protein quick-to-court isoform X2 [Ischnura elegans]
MSASSTREAHRQTPKSRIPLLRRSNSMKLPLDIARTPTSTTRECPPMSCDGTGAPYSTTPTGRPQSCRNPFADGKRSLSFAGGAFFRRQPDAPTPHSARAVTPLGMYLGAAAEESMARDARPRGDDADSLRSFGASSICSSIASVDRWSITPIGPPGHFAKNGTTYSGRQKKYVMHCSPHLDGNEETYLTPTQRAVRQIRKLKVILNQAKKEIESRDAEIARLKKELLALRHGSSRNDCSHRSQEGSSTHHDEEMAIVYMGSESGDYSDRHDDVEVLVGVLADMDRVLEDDNAIRLANQQAAEERLGRIGNHDPPSSLADSGHYEDLVSSSSVQSKESLRLSPGGDEDFLGGKTLLEEDPEEVVRARREEVEEELQRERRRSAQAIVDLKETHRAEMKALTDKLNEVEERAEQLKSEMEHWQSRAKSAEDANEEAQKTKELSEQKDKERQEALLLKMYLKGQEAARFEHADQVLEFAHKAPSRVAVPELLQQLQDTEAKLEEMKAMYRCALAENKRIQSLQNSTEADSTTTAKRANDPTITLQFLKTAVFYLLTDRAENTVDHLSAIESILGYSEQERAAIERANPSLSRK